MEEGSSPGLRGSSARWGLACSLFGYSEKFRRNVLCPADRSTYRGLRKIVSVQAADEVFLRSRYRLLSLNDFEVVRNSGCKPVTSLNELFGCEFPGALCNLDLLARGIEVEKGRPDLVIDATSQVRSFSPPLRQNSVCLFDLCPNAPTLKNWELQTYRRSVRSVIIAER